MLKSAYMETDCISRIVGDEFAVLMPSKTRAQAEIFFVRIREGGRV
jgi:GGDEF domain-containing protein